MTRSRIDIIGQNGNEGEHYEEVDKMSGGMDKDESCFGCKYYTYTYDEYPCSRCNRAFSGMQRDRYEKSVAATARDFNPTLSGVSGEDSLREMVRINQETGQYPTVKKDEEKQYLTKLIDDHWAYIEKLLEAHDTDKDIIEVAKFHYKSAGLHFWKHAMEYMEEGK